MHWHAAGLRRLDAFIWTATALTAATMLITAAIGSFTIDWRSFVAPGGTCLLLILGAFFYRHVRCEPKLASALESTAQLMAFAAAAAPLSYVAASAGLPLQDAPLGAIDHVLGFDWKGLLALKQRWPNIAAVLDTMYLSLTLQMTAVVLLLGFTGRLPWLRVYMLAFIFAALTTIAISAVLPAEGAWLHYGLQGGASRLPVSHTSWPVFLGLRDGTYRTIVAIGAEGIITFPSLHAALAVILIAALWPVPGVRWIGIAVNAMMLIATPIDGSHYLIDVLAGIAVAITAILAARALVAHCITSFCTATGGEAVPASTKIAAPAL